MASRLFLLLAITATALAYTPVPRAPRSTAARRRVLTGGAAAAALAAAAAVIAPPRAQAAMGILAQVPPELATREASGASADVARAEPMVPAVAAYLTLKPWDETADAEFARYFSSGTEASYKALERELRAAAALEGSKTAKKRGVAFSDEVAAMLRFVDLGEFEEAAGAYGVSKTLLNNLLVTCGLPDLLAASWR